MSFGKRFVCSGHDGSITHSFYETPNPVKPGQLVILFERHMGPCRCSFCRKGDPGYKRPFGWKLDGIGWNMLHWATPWACWYLRWARARV